MTHVDRRFSVALYFVDGPACTLTIDSTSPAHCLRYLADVTLAEITRRVVHIEVIEVYRTLGPGPVDSLER